MNKNKPACTSSSCRCQLKCDELNKRNKDLVSLLTALEEDKEDIAEYLIAKEAEEEKKVEEFAELLQNQQQAAERDVVALRLQHGEELPELSDRLQAERTVQGETGRSPTDGRK